MKICFFEFNAIPETSPRYISGGSFSTFGTESNGISGTSAAHAGVNVAAPRHASATNEYRFKVASFSLQLPYQMAAAGAGLDEGSGAPFGGDYKKRRVFLIPSVQSAVYLRQRGFGDLKRSGN